MNNYQTTPAVVAIEETYDATVSSSTELTLNAATTLIEVSAIDKTILLKWGTSDVSTSDFDEVISLNTTRQFIVPRDYSTNALYTAVNFIEQAATAILAVVEK
jgi:hypothetical protein